MTELHLQDLERIGLLAAQDVIGDGVDEVEVRPGVDVDHRPAYFITYRFHDEDDRTRASLLRIRLSQAIRDALINRGDQGYPYVRLLGDRDWALRGNADSG